MGVGCEDDSECKGEGSKCIQGMCKTGEGMGQRNVPSSKPANINGGEDDSSEGNRIDYASTLEQAYDNLQNMLGSDGMKGPTTQSTFPISFGCLLEQIQLCCNNFEGIYPFRIDVLLLLAVRV